MTDSAIEKVIDRHLDELTSLSGVVAVGFAEQAGIPYIVISVDRASRRWRKKIPKKIEGYPVRIEETGEYVAESG